MILAKILVEVMPIAKCSITELFVLVKKATLEILITNVQGNLQTLIMMTMMMIMMKMMILMKIRNKIKMMLVEDSLLFVANLLLAKQIEEERLYVNVCRVTLANPLFATPNANQITIVKATKLASMTSAKILAKELVE